MLPRDHHDAQRDTPVAIPRPDVASPVPLSDDVRQRFRRQKTRNTAPEMALRRELHALGLRYRVDVAVLPGVRRRPDVVFTAAHLAVFVDGCFWHRCPRHATTPRNNANWWAAKLQRTVDRDRDTDQRLVDAGWLVVRVWEHEAPDDAAHRIHQLVLTRRPAHRNGRRPPRHGNDRADHGDPTPDEAHHTAARPDRPDGGSPVGTATDLR